MTFVLPFPCVAVCFTRTFCPSGEAFLNDYRFLEELHERVPQELSPDEPRACLMSTVKAAGLMASLQASATAICCRGARLVVADGVAKGLLAT